MTGEEIPFNQQLSTWAWNTSI